MFRMKKKAALQPKLTILDRDGGILYNGPMNELTLTEETMKELSIQYFHDPEPCEIHRSAVMNWVFSELQEKLASGKPADIDSLDEEHRSYFSAYPQAFRVLLTAGKEGGGE